MSWLFGWVLGGCTVDATLPGEVPALDDLAPPAAAVVIDGTPMAFGLLAFLNDGETTRALLGASVAVDEREAATLMARRDGPDLTFGTGDDHSFRSVADLDAAHGIDPGTLGRLVAWCGSHGWTPRDYTLPAGYEAVPFTITETAAVLVLVNTAEARDLQETVPLDPRAVAGIVSARPITSVLELSRIGWVGTSALSDLKSAATGGYSTDVPAAAAFAESSVQSKTGVSLGFGPLSFFSMSTSFWEAFVTSLAVTVMSMARGVPQASTTS